jgi:hypothetical protein
MSDHALSNHALSDHAMDGPRSVTIDPDPQSIATPASVPVDAVHLLAERRFKRCRFARSDAPGYCAHPEVLPFSGTHGFTPASWCPECALYKIKKSAPRP